MITASAGGAFTHVDPYDLDGYLDVGGLSAEVVGGGTCSLGPSDECKLIVEMDADPSS